MKKTTLLGRLQALLLLFIFISGSVFAGNIIVNSNVSTSLKLNESTYSFINITNTISDIGFVDVKTKEGYFTLLSIENYGKSVMLGDPQLPVVKRLIEVPLNADFDIEIISQNYVEFNLSDYGVYDYVIPAQPSLSKSCDPEDVEFVYNKDIYTQDTYLGQDLVTVTDLGMMRGVRIARVEISPVMYNPIQNTIRVYSDIELKVNFTGGNIQSTIQMKKDMFSKYTEGLYSELINYKPIETKELITDEPPTFIIVSDPMFEDALQPFIEWKTKKGFYVVEAYTDDPNVGSTANSIKNYLTGFYNNPPDEINPQCFVLFVGDHSQVPAHNGTTGGHVSELYHCEYTGDIYPECYYGRFSANNVNELQPQIDKTLEYEQYLFPDPTFLDEVVMVAGNDNSWITHSNGQINYGTTYYFNAEHGIESHTYLQPEPGGGNYAQNIRQNVNDGVAYANYTAHCSPSGWADPSFTNNHVPQMTNAHKYPLMVGNCCQSNDITTTCFGESLLRAVDKGAIGYIGGTNSTYWDEDFWWGVGAENVAVNPVYLPDHTGAYDGTFHDMNGGEPLDQWFITQGQMFQAGNLAVTQAGGMEDYYWEIYCIMGDPSVMIYYSQPPDAIANYQALMPLASATFPVTTDPYSYVAISKGGVLHGCAIADETGYAEVNMFDPISVPGEADVVITGQNKKPYIGTVSVASPTTAYVLLDEFEIDDSDGNGNGLADFSENIYLDVTLENMGSIAATNLTATISTDDINVVIDDATASWTDIAAGTTSMQAAAFEFTVNDIIENEHVVSFDLEVTDGTDTWNSMFNVTLYAPILTIGSFTIDDSFGNNNGRLDPGENADIIIANMNEGGSDALNTVATAIAASSLITVNTASFDIGTIGIGGTADATINISIDPSAQIGDLVQLNYTVESEPYSANTVFAMSVGLIVEDFESGGFTNNEWEFSGNADWTIDQANPYEGVYCAKSGDISDEQTSVLFITIEVTNDDQISFFRKVSSEENYDYLRFYIDNVQKDEWAGEVGWDEASYDVSAGTHTFKWAYEKDWSVSNGSDCAWVDYIVFPSFAGSAPLGVVVSGNPSDLCLGESSQLNAFAMGGNGTYTYEWTPEDGLSDPTIANPVATPENTTTYSVVVDDGDGTVNGDVIITVSAVPEQPTIEQQGDILVSSATSGNQWYNSSGMIPGAINQSYTPTETDDYYVIASNEFGCESEPSDGYYFIYTGLIEIQDGQKVNIYPNPFNNQITVDYSINSNSEVIISIFNTIGQQIHILENEPAKQAGNYRINYTANRLETGIYYCKIETSEYTIVKRIIKSN